MAIMLVKSHINPWHTARPFYLKCMCPFLLHTRMQTHKLEDLYGRFCTYLDTTFIKNSLRFDGFNSLLFLIIFASVTFCLHTVVSMP